MIETSTLAKDARDFSAYCKGHSADALVPYKSVGGQTLCLGLYLPDNMDKDGKYPLLILIHGGGWSSKKIFPDQERWAGDYLGFLGRYYAEKGLICASVDYRLWGKEGQMQEAFDDCTDAVRFLQEQTRFPIDWDKVCVLGESAGGHLAACVAYRQSEVRSTIKGAVLVNPVTDFTDAKWAKFADGDAEKWSPLCAVETAAGIPCPTLILHGNADSTVHPNHSVALHDRLAEKGTDVTLNLLEGTNHAFLLVEYMNELGRDNFAAETAVRQIDSWFQCKRYLR